MTERPTHRHIKTGSIVFPQGYHPNAVVPLLPEEIAAIERDEALLEIKAEARRRIGELEFDTTAQLNAIREGRTDDPRFAEIDAIRAWSNDEEAKLRSA